MEICGLKVNNGYKQHLKGFSSLSDFSVPRMTNIAETFLSIYFIAKHYHKQKNITETR